MLESGAEAQRIVAIYRRAVFAGEMTKHLGVHEVTVSRRFKQAERGRQARLYDLTLTSL